MAGEWNRLSNYVVSAESIVSFKRSEENNMFCEVSSLGLMACLLLMFSVP